MIEVLKQQFDVNMAHEEKINRVREFLQLALLKIMYEQGHFNNLAFVGGTALRVLYDLRRFSEDLDFSLVKKAGYSFNEVNSQLKRGFNLFGLEVEIKPKEERVVQSSFIKFSGLLKELGLSELGGQKLSIKIEVDSNPPKGYSLESSFINKAYLFNLRHYDLSSLYATKIHACFFRKYSKGRDFYDLVWYISKNISPNYILLNNAIKQTEKKGLRLSKKNFREFLLEKLKAVDFKAIRKDVERFLEDKGELQLLDYNLIKASLDK